MNIKDLIVPKLEDGQHDQRFISLATQIQENISKSTINELYELWQETNQLENRYERSGLRFVIRIFQVDMEKWQRSAFKKTIRESLLRLGFKNPRVSKLMAAGEYVAQYITFEESEFGYTRKDHGKYLVNLRGYGVTSLYLLSCMDCNGHRFAEEHFIQKGKHLSTRELEKLKQQHPKWGAFEDKQRGHSFETQDVEQRPGASEANPATVNTQLCNRRFNSPTACCRRRRKKN